MSRTIEAQVFRRFAPPILVLVVFIVATSAGYEVQSGDTLASIAADHGTTISDLVATNSINDPNRIRAGQTLTIAGTPSETTHTVVPGETLAKIASSYGTTVSDLASANGLSNPNLLRIGQLIRIASTPSDEGVTSQVITGTHIVSAGESLASIARRYGTTVEAIAQVNGLTNPELIFVGTQLTIAEGVAESSTTAAPTSTSVHVVAPGETLGAIAARFGTSIQALISSNNLADANLIKPGQQISVPSQAWICPVVNPKYFNDWGFPRSGGRFHQGNDLFAPRNAEVRAPVSGFVELKSGIVGGFQFWLTGDDGRTYIGSHMEGFAQAGNVAAGTVIGYVGDSGNALGSDPHLHFEILVGGSPINPYPILGQSGC